MRNCRRAVALLIQLNTPHSPATKVTTMKHPIMTKLALAIVLGAASYWSAQQPLLHPASPASAAERSVLYYRDPSGAPLWSAAPKKDQRGIDYLPVYDDQEPSLEPPVQKAQVQNANGPRKIL